MTKTIHRYHSLFKYSVLLFLCTVVTELQAQSIISQFNWDNIGGDPLIADVGPNGATIQAGATIKAEAGMEGRIGLAPQGDPDRQNINMTITNTASFDVDGIDISFDYQRDESDAFLFERNTVFQMRGGSSFSIQFQLEDVGSGVSTINSGTFGITNDDLFRNYRFYYLPVTGVASLQIDGTEVWSMDGTDNRNMIWVGAGDIIIGRSLDGSGSAKAALDNMVVASVSDRPLPIELLSFTAKLENETVVKIEWKTASETNNDYFTVEKSFDNRNWEELELIDGAGTTNVPNSYSTQDQLTDDRTAYYRLKQTDLDGSFTYSRIAYVKPEFSTNELVVFPNPGESEITILLEDQDVSSWIMRDINGKQVKLGLIETPSAQTVLQIDISDLKSGTYFLTIAEKTMKVLKK